MDRIGRRRGLVEHMTLEDVLLGDGVGRGEAFRCAYAQLVDGFMQAGQLVVHLHVPEGHVALVGHGDGVFDSFAQLGLLALLLVGGLYHLQRGVHIVGFVLFLIAALRLLVGIIRFALGSGFVYHLAVENILLGYHICKQDFLGSAGRQRIDRGDHLALLGAQAVGHLDILRRQVAGVGHGDLVGNRFAQRVGFPVFRRAGGFLGHAQRAVGFFNFFGFRFHGPGGVFPRNRRRVAHGSRQNIRLGHHMLRLDFHLRIGRKAGNRGRMAVLRYTVALTRHKDGVGILHDDVLHDCRAHVLHRDGEGDRIAQLVIAFHLLGCGLVGSNLIALDFEQAGKQCDGVVGRHVRFAGLDGNALLHNRVIRADQRLLILPVIAHFGRHGIAVQQAFVHAVALHALGGMGHGAFIIVIVFQVVRRDSHRALADGQRAGHRLHIELRGHVIARRILHDGRASHRHSAAFAHVGGGLFSRQAGHGEGLLVHGEDQLLQAFHLQGRAVIDLAAAVGFHRKAILLVPVLHGQLAGLIGNGIVLRLGIGFQPMGPDLVRAGAHQRLAAFHGDACQSFFAHKRALGDLIAVIGQRRAVIDLFGAVGRQLDVHGLHRQRAILALGKGVVLGHVGFPMHDLVARHTVRAAARIGLTAFHGGGQHIAVHQHTLGVGVSAVGQRRAVIGLFFAGSGDGDGLFRDGIDNQAAVHDLEFHGGEILADVLKVLRLDAHGVFARVRARRRPGGGFLRGHIGRDIHVVQGVVGRHGRIAMHAVRLAVIGHGAALFGYRYDDLVGYGGDGQLALFFRDRVVCGHVLRAVHDLRFVFERAGVFAHVGARGGVGHDREGVALHQTALGDGGDALRFAVIHLGSGLAGKGHRALADGQRAGQDGDGVVAGHILIAGQDLHVVLHHVQLVFIGARVHGGEGNVRAGEGMGLGLVAHGGIHQAHAVILARRIHRGLIHRVRRISLAVVLAIVGHGIVCHGNGQGPGGDLQRAVDGFAEGVVGRRIPTRLVLHAEAFKRIELAAHIDQIGDIIAHDQPIALRQGAMKRLIGAIEGAAVIDLAVAQGFDHHRPGAPGDGKHALVLLDAVVPRIEFPGGGVFDGVGRLAVVVGAVGHVDHAAGSPNIRHLALHKAVGANGHLGHGQGRAVVFLALRLRGQLHFAGIDLQLARFQHDLIVEPVERSGGGIDDGVGHHAVALFAVIGVGHRAGGLVIIDFAVDDVAGAQRHVRARQRLAGIVAAGAIAGEHQLLGSNEHVGGALGGQSVQGGLEAHGIHAVAGDGALHVGIRGAFVQVIRAGGFIPIFDLRGPGFLVFVDIRLGHHAVGFAVVCVLIVLRAHAQRFRGGGDLKVAGIHADKVVGILDAQLLSRLGDDQHVLMGAHGVVARIGAVNGQVNARQLGLHLGVGRDNLLALIEAQRGVVKGRIGFAIYLDAVVHLHSHRPLFDVQIAVRHRIGNMLEILADGYEIPALQAHLMQPHVDAAGLGLRLGRFAGGAALAIGKVGIHVKERVGAGGRVALHGVRFCVIEHNRMIALDRHGHFGLDRVDLQHAVHDYEFHVVEILVGVFKVLRFDAHGIFARVGALGRPGGGGRFLHAGFHIVQRIVRRDGFITRDGMLGAVIGGVAALFGYRYGNLCGDRVDLQHAVHDYEFHVVEILVGVFKVLRFDAHGIFARVGALGRPGGGGRFLHAGFHIVQRIVRRDGFITRDGMLGAVIGGGVALFSYRHGDLVGNWIDYQRAVLRLGHDILPGRVHRAHGVFREGRRIGVGVRSRRANLNGAEVRSLGSAGEAGDGMLLAVIGHVIALGGQLHVLIVVENDFICFRADGDGLAGSGNRRTAVHRFRAFGGGGAIRLSIHRFAFGHRRGGAVPIVVNGIAQVSALGKPRNVRRIGIQPVRVLVQAGLRRRRRQGRLAADLGFALIPADERIPRVRGRSGARHRIAAHNLNRIPGMAYRALLRILAGICYGYRLPRVQRPDSIEGIIPMAVNENGHVAIETVALAIRLGIPARQRVAPTGEGRAAQRGNGGVIFMGDRCGGLAVRRLAAIAIIGQGDGGGRIPPLGGEGHIAGNGQLIAGLLDFVRAPHPPADEHLACRRGEPGGGLHIRFRAAGIAPRVLNRARALARVVGYLILVFVDIVGIQLNILVNFGVEIKGRVNIAVLGRPGNELPAVAFRRCRRGEIVRVDRTAVGDGNRCAAIACHGDVGSARHRRRCPLGVDGDILGGHFAGEHMEHLSGGVVIPALEGIVLFSHGRRRRGLVRRVGDGLLKEDARPIRGDLAAAVHINNGVAVAGVIEFGVIVSTASFRAYAGVKRIAGNGILILHGDRVSRAGGGVLVVELIALAADGNRAGLPGQNLDIVVRRFGAVAGFRAVELGAVQRHGVNVDLIGAGAVALRCPCAAAVIGRPLIADRGAVFGGNAQVSILLTSGTVELHIVHIPLVIHADNGGAVSRDGRLGDGLGGEACIVPGGGGGLSAGRACFFLGFFEGVSVIIRVFHPVDDGILGILVRLPLGGQRFIRGQRTAKGKGGARFVLPAGKGIARLLGDAGINGRLPRHIECRRVIGAAVGFEGQVIALLHLGPEGDVRVAQGHMSFLNGLR